METYKEMSGKVLLITGGCKMFGRSIAKAFLMQGARVIISDIADDAGAEAQKELSIYGDVKYRHMDVSNPEEVRATMTYIKEKYGGLDFAINSAAYYSPVGKLHELDNDVTKRLFEIDLLGMFYCMKYELELMVKKPSAVVINISSQIAFHEMGGLSTYAAAKHGVIGLTKSSAVDYAHNGIRVLALCPGSMMNEGCVQMRDNDPEAWNARLSRLPCRRIVPTEEIADILLFLCTDAARAINGTAIMADELVHYANREC